MEKVSVIMAVYNGEDYLKKSIESILRQTYPYFEFIIVNDGSSDATKNILNSIKDPRVKVYHLNKNYGVSYARNYAVKEAKCRWIVLQDHDDISAPDRLEVLMNYINKNPELISVLSMFQLFEEKVSAKGRSLNLMAKGPYFTRKQLRSRRFYCPWICFGSAAISREAFLQAGGYDHNCKLGEDFDLFLKLMELGPVAMIPRVLYRYRFNPNSTSRRNRPETRSAIIKIALKHIINMFLKRGLRPFFAFFGSAWDCYNLAAYVGPEIGLEVKLCFESGSPRDLAKAFALYKQKKVNGFIVLGSSVKSRQTISWLLRQGMTLNVNLFHLKPFKKARALSYWGPTNWQHRAFSQYE